MGYSDTEEIIDTKCSIVVVQENTKREKSCTLFGIRGKSLSSTTFRLTFVRYEETCS